MKQIKFRAWNEHKQEMMYDFTIVSDGSNRIAWFDEYHHFGVDFPIMQFTGLKDKNGVEIYEGDIVKSSEWNPEIYKVGFDRGGFCFYRDDLDFANDAKYLEEFEVIGNIYENGDLCKN